MRRLLRAVTDSAVVYPTSLMFIAGVVALEGVVADLVRLDTAIIGLGIVAVIIILASIYHEVRGQRVEVKEVHVLVNSQRDELVERIEQLVVALQDASVAVPKASGGTTR
jgi:hypothetical protein